MDPYTALIYMAASILISLALAPKPPIPEPAAFEDFNIPQVDEGTPMAVTFGEVWTGDWQVIGKGNYRTRPVRASGGKK